DGCRAALLHELLQRQLETFLAPVGGNGLVRVGRACKGVESAGTDAAGLSLLGKGDLPPLEAARVISACRCVRRPGQCQAREKKSQEKACLAAHLHAALRNTRG